MGEVVERISVGYGFASGGAPLERGRLAASQALLKAREMNPSLVWLMTNTDDAVGEVVRGVRSILEECPMIGQVMSRLPAPVDPASSGSVWCQIISSPYIRAKIGFCRARSDDFQGELTEAFQRSYFIGKDSFSKEGIQEESHLKKYFYRRPTFAAALFTTGQGDRETSEALVAGFLQKNFQGKVPFLTSAIPRGRGNGCLIADDDIVKEGTIIAVIKSDLNFIMKRFHQFEPTGNKLVPTRTEGRMIIEFNGRPALSEYLSAVGADEKSRSLLPELFGTHPLAQRTTDGRYQILMPEDLGGEPSLVMPCEFCLESPFYLMAPVSPQNAVKMKPGLSRGGLLLDDTTAFHLILRNPDLNDRPLDLVVSREPEGQFPRTIQMHPLGKVSAYIPEEECPAEASHLSLAFSKELHPIAVASSINEQLFENVLRLKNLNQMVFDGIGYGIAVLNKDRKILHCNETYTAMTGLTGEDLEREASCSTEKFGDSCHECMVLEAFETGSFTGHEVEKKVGENDLYLRIDAFPLKDEDGETHSVVEVIRDLSEIRKLQISLEREKRKMEAVVEGMAEPVYIVSPEFDIQFVQHVPESLPVIEDYFGKKCYKAIFKRDGRCPWCRLEETLEKGEVIRQMVRIEDGEGEEKHYQITFSPWKDEEGRTAAAICLLVDITSQKEMEHYMIQSEKLRSLSVLSAGMAHELKNPLGAINFNLEVLMNLEKDDYSSLILDAIKDDAVRINRIVNNLLSFARTGARSFSPVDLEEVLESSLELFRTLIDEEKVEVTSSFEPGLPMITGNFQDLQQVFGNLISNSLEAMPVGGKIDIRARAVRYDYGSAKKLNKVIILDDKERHTTLLKKLKAEGDLLVEYYQRESDALFAVNSDPLSCPDVIFIGDGVSRGTALVSFLKKLEDLPAKTKVIVVDDTGKGGEGMNRDQTSIIESIHSSAEIETYIELIRKGVSSNKSSTVEPAVVEVSFADTGFGIPTDVQDRIYDPFFTTKIGSKGNGLGLSVVHKILENHSTSINVVSRPGLGTTFLLRFPVLLT
jgi:signal transduction histidine kinase